MSMPKVCPVCGKDSIRPIPRAELIPIEEILQSGYVHELRPGVLGYRCGEGHFFLIGPDEKDHERIFRKPQRKR